MNRCLWKDGKYQFKYGYDGYGTKPSLIGQYPDSISRTYYWTHVENFPLGIVDVDLFTLRAQLDSLGLELFAECTIEIQTDKITILTQGHALSFPGTWTAQ